MNRYLMLTWLIIYFGMCSHAQENINMTEILNIEQDIVSLENRIISSIEINNPDIANIQGLRQFHILWLGFDPANKVEVKREDYSNHSFLYRLGCTYFNLSSKVKKIKGKKSSFLYRLSPYLYFHIKSSKPLFRKEKKYLQTTTLITDSVGNLVAIGGARLVHIAPAFFQSDIELAKMFFDKKIDFVFYMGGNLRNYIGIKSNKLYALERTQKGLKIYPWEEFMECCFDEWVYPGKKQE